MRACVRACACACVSGVGVVYRRCGIGVVMNGVGVYEHAHDKYTLKHTHSRHIRICMAYVHNTNLYIHELWT